MLVLFHACRGPVQTLLSWIHPEALHNYNVFLLWQLQKCAKISSARVAKKTGSYNTKEVPIVSLTVHPGSIEERICTATNHTATVSTKIVVVLPYVIAVNDIWYVGQILALDTTLYCNNAWSVNGHRSIDKKSRSMLEGQVVCDENALCYWSKSLAVHQQVFHLVHKTNRICDFTNLWLTKWKQCHWCSKYYDLVFIKHEVEKLND